MQEAINYQSHWENVYNSKSSAELSWTQDTPETSLHFIRSLDLPKTARIIDVGGGDSRLADFLIAEGYQNITVLDISAKALEKAQKRLGEKAASVNWIVQDITHFKPTAVFDLWHDRAAFHFMITEHQVSQYLSAVHAGLHTGGYLMLGTFSESGPDKCSGLPVRKYSEDSLSNQFGGGFSRIACVAHDHITPFGTTQNFLFCCFKKQALY